MKHSSFYKGEFSINSMLKLEKKGQLTLFIILAILIVGGIAVFFLVSNSSIISAPNSKFPEINSFIENCIKETTMEAIYFNSLQGGYYKTLPKMYSFIPLEYFKVPVYFKEGKANIPKLEMIEAELSKYVSENFVSCINLLNNSFSEKGIVILPGKLKSVQTSILPDEVLVRVDYPITVSSNEFSVNLRNFEGRADFDFEKIMGDISSFIEIQKTNPKFILFTQMEDFSEENGLEIESFKMGNTSDYVHNFIYPLIKYNNRTYIFSFGVSY